MPIHLLKNVNFLCNLYQINFKYNPEAPWQARRNSGFLFLLKKDPSFYQLIIPHKK